MAEKPHSEILRGWVSYFAIGNSSRCFGYVKDWVEEKIRGHIMRAQVREGFGWVRWSNRWLYGHRGLFNGSLGARRSLRIRDR